MSAMVEHLAEGITLYLGDSRDIVPSLGRVDSVVCDPPYEFQSSGGGLFRASRQGWMTAVSESQLDRGFDHSFLTSDICDSAVCFCHNDQIPALSAWFSEQFERFVLLMWHKTNPMPVANKHYIPDTEFYFHAWNKASFPTGELKSKGWYFMAPVGSSDFDHPTVKPLPLMEKIIRNVQGKTILDPYCGTGSTGIAAIRDNRNFIGVEINQKYFDIACFRICDELARPRLDFSDHLMPAKQESFI